MNYCPKCGDEILDDAGFCHSCGLQLNETKNIENEDSEDNKDTLEEFRFIDEVSMDDFSREDLRGGENEYYEILKNAIDEMLEKEDITIDELDAEQYFTYVLVDRIFQRSTRLKLNHD